MRRGRLGWIALVALVAAVLIALWWAGRGDPPAILQERAADGATSAGSRPGADASTEAKPPPPRLDPRASSLPPVRVERDDRARGGRLSGRVVSAASGLPIAAAEVTFASPAGALSQVTGADGAFAIAPEEPGTCQIAAVTAEGFVPFAPDWGRSPIAVVLAQGVAISDLVIALEPAPEIVGAVVDARGQPVEGAQVKVLAPALDEAVLFPLEDRFTSDARGEFRFRAPDGAVVQASHKVRGEGLARIDADVLRLRRVQVKLVERPSGERADVSLGGRVTLPDGTGAAGALVWVRSAASIWPKLHGPEVGQRAFADDEGRFEVSGLERGTYDVSAHLLGYAPARVVDLKVPSKPLALRLEAGAKLVGRVSAEDGAAVPAFGIELSWHKGAVETTEYARASFVNAAGQYEIEGLAPGTYSMRVTAAGFAPVEGRVEVPEGATEIRRDVTMPRGGRVTGRVITAGTGAPIERARISIESGSAPGALGLGFGALSQADGSFDLEGVPESGVTLSVAASGHDTKLVPGVRPGAAVVVELNPTPADAGTKVELVGIGAVLRPREDVLVVGEVMAGGGAAEAGLGPGDEIHGVEGTPVAQLGFGGAVQRIRGPEGTTVTLSVRKSGAKDVQDIPVTRRKIGR